MVRRIVFVGLVVLPLVAVAQTPPAPTPAMQCRQKAQMEQGRLLAAERAAGRTPDAPAISAAAKQVARECGQAIDVATSTMKGRSDLVALHLYTNDTAKAEGVVEQMLGVKGTEAERAEALIAAEQMAIAKSDAFAGLNLKAEGFVHQIDAMSDSALEAKLTAHAMLLARYNYADNFEGIRQEANRVLPLAKRALDVTTVQDLPARPAMGNQPAIPPLKYGLVVGALAYSSLARVAGGTLHADSAMMILDEGARFVGTSFPPLTEQLALERKRYALVGTPAQGITGKWWVNAADGTELKPGEGKVSLIQFTAHWCVPCKKSYPPTLRLMERFKGKPVESFMATSLYGYVGARRGLTPEQEVEADREYYANEHALPFQVAINPSGPGVENPNDTRYVVSGIPEIVVVDRKGIIRAVVVGWDQGNEARLGRFIERLLAEK